MESNKDWSILKYKTESLKNIVSGFLNANDKEFTQDNILLSDILFPNLEEVPNPILHSQMQENVEYFRFKNFLTVSKLAVVLENISKDFESDTELKEVSEYLSNLGDDIEKVLQNIMVNSELYVDFNKTNKKLLKFKNTLYGDDLFYFEAVYEDFLTFNYNTVENFKVLEKTIEDFEKEFKTFMKQKKDDNPEYYDGKWDTIFDVVWISSYAIDLLPKNININLIPFVENAIANGVFSNIGKVFKTLGETFGLSSESIVKVLEKLFMGIIKLIKEIINVGK